MCFWSFLWSFLFASIAIDNGEDSLGLRKTEFDVQAVLSEFTFPSPPGGSNGGCRGVLSQGGFGSMVMSEVSESRPKGGKAPRGSLKPPAWWFEDTSGTANGGGVSASDGSDTTQVGPQ